VHDTKPIGDFGDCTVVDLKIRSENEDSCLLSVALRPLYIHQIGNK